MKDRSQDSRRIADVDSHIIPSVSNDKPDAHQAARRTMAEHFKASESWNKNSGSRLPSPEALRPKASSDVVSASNTLSKGK